jgi:hypothetical protein
MANRFWVGGTGTWDASDTTHWAASSGGAGGQSVPTSGDNVTLDSNSGGGTVTVNTNFNLGANGGLTTDTFNGTLDFATNNNSPTMRNFQSGGTTVRTLNMGNGTWTFLTPGGPFVSIWGSFNASNFTLNANGSTILWAPSSLSGGASIDLFNGATLNNISVSFPSVSRFPFYLNWLSGTVTCANLTLTNVRNVTWLRGSSTLAVTNTLTWPGGTSISDMAALWARVENDTINTISVANATTFNWMGIIGHTKAGAGSITANNSVNLGLNTGITFNPPSIGGGLRMAGPGGLAS